MHDVAVWANPDRSAENTREVKWAASCYFCKRSHLDRLANVRDDVVPKSRQDLLPQCAAYLKLRVRRMTHHQAVDERAGQLIPEQGPVRVVTPALRNQGIRNTEKLLIAAGQALDQLRFQRRVVCGRESKMARIDGDENGIDASFGIG